MRESRILHRLPIPRYKLKNSSLSSFHCLATPQWYISITTTYLDSFQYAATSNFGRTRVAFSKRATPTPSHNCINCQQGTIFSKTAIEINNIRQQSESHNQKYLIYTHISPHLIEATIAIHTDISITLRWESCRISTKNQCNCLQ